MDQFTPDEIKVFDVIDAHIVENKYLNPREKLQSWIWIYSNYQEKRFSLEELRLIAEHLHQHATFFPDLLKQLREINTIIKSQDKAALLQKFQESLKMMETLARLEELTLK